MSYIGSTPTTQSFIAGTDYFNGNGSTVNFTLSRSVNSVNDIEVIVNNVEQIPSGYSVSGTTLTFSAAPSAGTSNIYVRYLSTTNLSLAIPAGTSAAFNTVTATTLAATNSSYTGTLTGAAATFSGIVAANGGGIQFPATQVASAGANTLDDYEEGTFTPIIVGGTTAGTATYTQQTGQYTKIGNRVLISIRIGYNSGTGTGALNIGGLPFTTDGTGASLSNYSDGISMTAGHVMQLIAGTSSTLINVNSVATGGGSDANVAYDAQGFMAVNGNYKIA